MDAIQRIKHATGQDSAPADTLYDNILFCFVRVLSCSPSSGRLMRHQRARGIGVSRCFCTIGNHLAGGAADVTAEEAVLKGTGSDPCGERIY